MARQKLELKQESQKLESKVLALQTQTASDKEQQLALFKRNDAEYEEYRANETKLQELRIKSHEMDQSVLQIRYQISELQKRAHAAREHEEEQKQQVSRLGQTLVRLNNQNYSMAKEKERATDAKQAMFHEENSPLRQKGRIASTERHGPGVTNFQSLQTPVGISPINQTQRKTQAEGSPLRSKGAAADLVARIQTLTTPHLSHAQQITIGKSETSPLRANTNQPSHVSSRAEEILNRI